MKLGFPCENWLPQVAHSHCNDDTRPTLSRQDCLETFLKGPDITCQKDRGELGKFKITSPKKEALISLKLSLRTAPSFVSSHVNLNDWGLWCIMQFWPLPGLNYKFMKSKAQKTDILFQWNGRSDSTASGKRRALKIGSKTWIVLYLQETVKGTFSSISAEETGKWRKAIW